MTDNRPARKAIASARRNGRYAARSWLWDNSSLRRPRSCGLRAQGSQRDPLTGAQTAREGAVVLRVHEGATEGRRAGWSGLQSCGSTWACPVCAEKIQAHRNAEVATALATARARGLVVGFLTFTVRHRKRHSLADVWAAVSKAWRAATSGAGPAWAADRDAFGVVGYLRLTEVTHGGSNGWHVHVHALVFLRPHGRPITGRVHRQGPANFVPGPRALIGRMGPFTEDETRRLDPWMVGPLTEAETRARMVGPGSVVEHTGYTPCGRAVENSDRDGRLALYARDVEDLGARMGARWRDSLAGTAFEPDDDHGVDARLVTDAADLAAYFAKHMYSVKSVESAAFDVTGSYAKEGRRGNVTPFGILARIVEAPETVDPETGELTRTPNPADVALWREWEQVSKGKRQLLWSNGLRGYLGLAADPETDEAIADAPDEGRDLVRFHPRDYRQRIALAGLGPVVMAAAERSDHDLERLLLTLRVRFEWCRGADSRAYRRAWADVWSDGWRPVDLLATPAN